MAAENTIMRDVAAKHSGSRLDLAPAAQIEKRSIAQSFGASASSYNSGAALQRLVGNRLLDLTRACRQGILLDLGTGPGYFSSALAERCQQLLGLDISPQMLEFAQRQNADISPWWLAGDAEHLPLAGDSIAGIYSSLMLQWTHDFAQALREAKRVLQPGGQLAFSSLVDGSLFELVNAWRQVDNHQHVNSFMTQAQLDKAIAQSGLKVCHLEVKPQVIWYQDVVSLMKDLKAIGANQTARSRRGLMGKQQLRLLKQGYEKYRREGRLPATYQVVYAVLEKS